MAFFKKNVTMWDYGIDALHYVIIAFWNQVPMIIPCNPKVYKKCAKSFTSFFKPCGTFQFFSAAPISPCCSSSTQAWPVAVGIPIINQQRPVLADVQPLNATNWVLVLKSSSFAALIRYMVWVIGNFIIESLFNSSKY